jgi:membrane protease subunit HflC
VQRFDRRLQTLDLPGAELLTRDPRRDTIDKTLTLDAYVCWRIPDKKALDTFIRKVGTLDGARAILSQRLNSDLGAAVGKMELDDLISVWVGSSLPSLAASTVGLVAAPDLGPLLGGTALLAVRNKVDLQRVSLRDRLLDGDLASGMASLKEAALREYGIEVVDLRLRRINHPVAVRQAIFERIISEREKKVADYRSEGERLASDIRSAGDRKVAELKAAADAEAIRIRGEGESEADRIRNKAATMDPKFYTFLRNLEDYQRIFGDNKTILLLSTHRELFDAFFKPPTPDRSKPEPKEGK